MCSSYSSSNRARTAASRRRRCDVLPRVACDRPPLLVAGDGATGGGDARAVVGVLDLAIDTLESSRARALRGDVALASAPSSNDDADRCSVSEMRFHDGVPDDDARLPTTADAAFDGVAAVGVAIAAPPIAIGVDECAPIGTIGISPLQADDDESPDTRSRVGNTLVAEAALGDARALSADAAFDFATPAPHIASIENESSSIN
jgi:hypothetical protein